MNKNSLASSHTNRLQLKKRVRRKLEEKNEVRIKTVLIIEIMGFGDFFMRVISLIAFGLISHGFFGASMEEGGPGYAVGYLALVCVIAGSIPTCG